MLEIVDSITMFLGGGKLLRVILVNSFTVTQVYPQCHALDL